MPPPELDAVLLEIKQLMIFPVPDEITPPPEFVLVLLVRVTPFNVPVPAMKIPLPEFPTIEPPVIKKVPVSVKMPPPLAPLLLGWPAAVPPMLQLLSVMD